MKKMITVFAFIVLCWTGVCSNVKENNESEIADSNYSTNVVANESSSDDNANEDEKKMKVDAANRTIIAKALEEENNRNIRFILSSLKTINAGQIQSAEMAEENGEKVINLVAEDSTEYGIYLSKRGSVEAVKNLVTGEWPISSDR